MAAARIEMKSTTIRYFLALCEELNFTRAARRCGVSQPSLTNAIGALERQLGGTLFQRKPLIARTALGRSAASGAEARLAQPRWRSRDFFRLCELPHRAFVSSMAPSDLQAAGTPAEPADAATTDEDP
jgi:Bacterial regulatory helix-turn-helix protein, lysR family